MIERFVWMVADKNVNEFLQLYNETAWSDVYLVAALRSVDPKEYFAVH